MTTVMHRQYKAVPVPFDLDLLSGADYHLEYKLKY